MLVRPQKVTGAYLIMFAYRCFNNSACRQNNCISKNTHKVKPEICLSKDVMKCDEEEATTSHLLILLRELSHKRKLLLLCNIKKFCNNLLMPCFATSSPCVVCLV